MINNKIANQIIAAIFAIAMLICSILIIISTTETFSTFLAKENIKRIAGAALGVACAMVASIMFVDSFYKKIPYGGLVLHALSALIGILAVAWVIDAKIDFVISGYDTHDVWIAFMSISLAVVAFDLAKLMPKLISKIAKKIQA